MDSYRISHSSTSPWRIARLRLGAAIHFIIAAGHIVCIFFLEESLNAYGLWDKMMTVCHGILWMPYFITACLSIAFAIAGLYGLAESKDITQLPFQKLAIATIVGIYCIRACIGIYWLSQQFSYLELFSTFTPCVLIWCYMPGIRHHL